MDGDTMKDDTMNDIENAALERSLGALFDQTAERANAATVARLIEVAAATPAQMRDSAEARVVVPFDAASKARRSGQPAQRSGLSAAVNHWRLPIAAAIAAMVAGGLWQLQSPAEAPARVAGATVVSVGPAALTLPKVNDESAHMSAKLNADMNADMNADVDSDDWDDGMEIIGDPLQVDDGLLAAADLDFGLGD